jgi:hypothetical protein
MTKRLGNNVHYKFGLRFPTSVFTSDFEGPPLGIPWGDSTSVPEEQRNIQYRDCKCNPQPEILKGCAIVGIAAVDPAPVLLAD